MNEATEIHHN